MTVFQGTGGRIVSALCISLANPMSRTWSRWCGVTSGNSQFGPLMRCQGTRQVLPLPLAQFRIRRESPIVSVPCGFRWLRSPTHPPRSSQSKFCVCSDGAPGLGRRRSDGRVSANLRTPSNAVAPSLSGKLKSERRRFLFSSCLFSLSQSLILDILKCTEMQMVPHPTELGSCKYL